MSLRSPTLPIHSRAVHGWDNGLPRSGNSKLHLQGNGMSFIDRMHLHIMLCSETLNYQVTRVLKHQGHALNWAKDTSDPAPGQRSLRSLEMKYCVLTKREGSKDSATAGGPPGASLERQRPTWRRSL